MKKHFILLAVGISISMISFSQQQPIDVTEQTIKIGAKDEQILYYGFAEGDRIIFNFNELNNKELQEIEIIEYPSNSKYMEYKSSKIENKTISVNKKSVYKFRFYNNNAINGRICKIKIQRIPSSDLTKGFNTSVTWVTKQDTSWNTYTKDIVIGYDTTYTSITKKYFVKNDTIIDVVKDNSVIKVHSKTDKAGNPNKTVTSFQLPEGTTYWAYSIGVGQEAKAKTNQAVKNVCSAAKTISTSFPNQYSLALYALGYGVDFLIPNSGSNVFYRFLSDNVNAINFSYGNAYTYISGAGGDVIFDYGKMYSPTKGTVYIGMLNDNTFYSIDVTVSIIAIKVKPIYEEKQEQQRNIKPIYEKKIFKDPIINTTEIPIIGQ